MSYKITVTGIKELENKFKNITVNTAKVINEELKDFGNNTVTDAKRRAPVNDGYLVNHISSDHNDLEVIVTVAADYAAYVEFGTKRFAAEYVSRLPPDWQTFAAKFKGRGNGSFEEFVERITRWVIKNKIGATYNVQTRRRDRVGKQTAKTTSEADAYGIALYIIRNGIRAQPFLYPAVNHNKDILIANLKKRQ